MESEIQSLKNTSEEKTVTAQNLRNQLLSAQNQLEALDGQISRDRDKLLKLREDKKILLEKVSCLLYYGLDEKSHQLTVHNI